MREPPVDGAVGVAEGPVGLDVLDEVVGEGPQHAVRHALVERLELGRLEGHPADGERGVVGGVPLHERRVLAGLLHGHPGAAAGFEHGQQRRGEAAQARRPPRLGLADGGAVGDEDEGHGADGRGRAYAGPGALFARRARA